MDLKKVGIAVGVVFVLFFVISQPQNSADFVLSILRLLQSAANSVVLFLRALLGF